MKMKVHGTYTFAALAIFLQINVVPNTARAQGTAFTYQGRLSDGGLPANGSYDIKFTVENAFTGGGAVAGPVTNSATAVSNGLFIVTLDFGSGVFTGASRWLEIAARSNGIGSFVVLAPRQAVLPAPYAIFANTASNLSGSLPAAQLSGPVLNSQLANNSLTVAAGTGLSGGGLVALGGSATLNNAGVLSVTGNADITASPTSGNVMLGSTATNANTASRIVKRDASGNFSAGSITLAGNLNLPATTAGTGIINIGGVPLLHAYGTENSFVGPGAGNFFMTGAHNAGSGEFALSANTTGSQNTANGAWTLESNTNGFDNTANGFEALLFNTSGVNNTADGVGALENNTTGSQNTALGQGAGFAITTGSFNITIGDGSYGIGGDSITTGSWNIDIGNSGTSTDSDIIRIGTSNRHTNTFIAGISGATAVGGSAVYVTSAGQLGTITSSSRFKDDIRTMADASDALLSLRPVTFRYKPGIDPKGIPQFGLVAEEVEKVDPDLVLRDDKGQVYTVRYEAVNAMLLNEFLKEHRRVEELQARLEKLEQLAAAKNGSDN
jgi:hypothetical protein